MNPAKSIGAGAYFVVGSEKIEVMSDDKDKQQEVAKPTDEKSTIMSSGVQGIKDRVQKFMDEQRLERLQQCREIERVLKHCQERRQKMLASEKGTPEEVNLGDTVPGIRMMRYFGSYSETYDEGQRFSDTLLHPAEALDVSSVMRKDVMPPSATNADDSVLTTTIPSCAMEAHALWGCRSVCLGCAGHLRHLRECFEGTPGVFETAETSYEPSKNGNTINVVPCQSQQQALGKCVITQARELQQRMNP